MEWHGAAAVFFSSSTNRLTFGPDSFVNTCSCNCFVNSKRLYIPTLIYGICTTLLLWDPESLSGEPRTPLHPNVSLQREHPTAVLQLWLCFPLMKLRPWPATANMLAQHKSPPPLSFCQPFIYSRSSCTRPLLVLLLLPQHLLQALCRRASVQWMLTEPCCLPMIYML